MARKEAASVMGNWDSLDLCLYINDWSVMCGIAGIATSAPTEGLESRLSAMLYSIAHRGQDGIGHWIDPAGNCILGHRRLAIIDLENGSQPMSNEDNSIWITFNGCIYNYQDLARDLRQFGHKLRTNSDTEIIIHAYEEWGYECVNRFNGMWAFAIRDTRKDIVFASRDRIGIKPFYYTWDGQEFGFASEIKALFAGELTIPEVSTDGIRQYLTFQLCLNDQTMFRNVVKLLPGHNLVFTPGKGPKVFQYWDLKFDVDMEHDEQWFIDQLGKTVEDAVRLRLRSDVALGAHLSGGLDSSYVVSMARFLLGNAPLRTFTGAFAEPGFDETRYAKEAAQFAKAEYTEQYIGPKDFADNIEKIIWHMDEPAAGPGVFPQYMVSRLAADHVKVVLGGQGGDEIFIGYARYLLAYLEECIKGAIEGTSERANYVATLQTIVPSLPTLESYMPMIKSFWRDGVFDVPARRYYRLMDRFVDSKGLLTSDAIDLIDRDKTFEDFSGLFINSDAGSMVNHILNFDTKTHLQSLLHVEDRTSMAWGLESRVPLLDYRIIELMASVPPIIKFKYGQLKYLYRQVIKNSLPAMIIERKDKMGFPVPFNQWLGNELREFVSDTLLSKCSHDRGLFDAKMLEEALAKGNSFSRGLWGALCLELWYVKFIDSAKPHGQGQIPGCDQSVTISPNFASAE